jgi:MurNAc alpha-1-phosphate uridylyltransferase
MLPRTKPTKAMVFAAGLGTRMRPISDALPKPLVKVGDRTLIDHVLDRLAEGGVTTAVVNVHYLADQLERHLARRTEPKIIISDERDLLLDQGGGIRKAFKYLNDGPFFICNTDAFWLEGPQSNLGRLVDAWEPETMDIALLVASAATSVGVDWPGDFSMDAQGRLTKRSEGEVVPFVYAGIGIVKPELFRNESREVFKLAPYFFEAARQGRLFGVRLEGLWMHVGTPEMIDAAERAVRRSAL